MVDCKKKKRFDMVVIGVSAGGLNALLKILPVFNNNFHMPVVIVQHLHPEKYGSGLAELLDKKCRLKVIEADPNIEIKGGNIYFAPVNYHLLIEEDRTFSLSADEKVNYSRPSIDVLFDSAADVYQANLIGIILTGANDDGAAGMNSVKEHGGMTIVQDPASAEYDTMPKAAIKACEIDHVLPLEKIAEILNNLQ